MTESRHEADSFNNRYNNLRKNRADRYRRVEAMKAEMNGPLDQKEFEGQFFAECPLCKSSMHVIPKQHPFYIPTDSGKRIWVCSQECTYGERKSTAFNASSEDLSRNIREQIRRRERGR